MNDQASNNARERMLKARETVARKNVFFASVLYHTRMVPSNKQEDIWTNGIDVYYNPDYVTDHANEKFIEGELLFQTLRCAFNHVSRREERDHKQWNVASELALTPSVKMVFPLPPKALEDPKYRNMSSEEVYEKLPKQSKGDGEGEGDGKGKGQQKPQQGRGKPKPGDGNGDREPGMGEMEEPPSQEELEEAEKEWERVTKVAADRAEKAGTMPGFLKRMVEELWPKYRIDWRLLIDDMAREAKANVYGNWSRPNRKLMGHGVIFPGWTKDNVYRLVICLDTSGSITNEQIRDMKSEAMSLLDQQIVTHVTMISTDTRVCNVMDVSTSEEVKNFDLGSHGGGTDFKAAMAHVATIEDAVGCVFLTDMYTSDFGKDPGIPTVWVDWGNSGAKAPFGVTTTYK